MIGRASKSIGAHSSETLINFSNTFSRVVGEIGMPTTITYNKPITYGFIDDKAMPWFNENLVLSSKFKGMHDTLVLSDWTIFFFFVIPLRKSTMVSKISLT
jgi:hypothetical protein